MRQVHPILFIVLLATAPSGAGCAAKFADCEPDPNDTTRCKKDATTTDTPAAGGQGGQDGAGPVDDNPGIVRPSGDASAPETNSRDGMGVGEPGPDASQGPPPGPRVPTDGRRLKAKGLESSPGHRTFDGWFDTVLTQDCSFAVAADGELRCIPGEFWSRTAELFTDPMCQVSTTAFLSSRCSTPNLVRRRVTVAGVCESRTAVYSVRPFKPAAVFVKDSTTGTCRPGLPDAATTGLYVLDKELPATMFLRGTVTPVKQSTVDDPIEFLEVTAEDGAVEPIAPRSKQSGKNCNFWSDMDSKQFCLPTYDFVYQSSQTKFSDPKCESEPLVSVDGRCGRGPELALLIKALSGSCAATRTWYQVGQTPKMTFVRDAGMCIASSTKPEQEDRALGAEVRVDSYPTVTLRNDDSTSHRLRRRILVTPGGQEQVANSSKGWFDSFARRPCVPIAVGRANSVCIPANVTFVGELGEFADARCSVPVYRRPGLCDPLPEFVVASGADTCQERPAIYRVGDSHRGQVFALIETDGTSTCVLSEAAPPSGSVQTLITVPETELPTLAHFPR